MKKILITGANSYIGMSFERYMAQWPQQYQVDTMDMVDGSWREKSFAGYDAVYHVAGIAHVKETKENAHLYYKVNRDLAVDVAKKAKADGVPQFVFLSSMSVYGVEVGVITRATQTSPVGNYGKSKLQAEEQLCPLRDDSFRIAIMRPPMVYGAGCKGNYQSLIKIAKIAPVIPSYKNVRSMVHIDRLCAIVRELIDSCADGLFFPQDEQHVCTCEMIRNIATDMGRNVPVWPVLNPAIALLKICTFKGRKAFGNLYYPLEDSNFELLRESKDE